MAGETQPIYRKHAFGEDDFRVLRTAGISAIVCPVDMAGQFTAEVTDFAGMHVKEADKHIIRKLKDAGSLYRQDVLVHSYPFCPRSDTPIIYRTIDSWYVSVESMRDDLQKSNAEINWVPDHMKAGRMGNWLEGAIDWSISRNRYWGTPLPVWINDATGAMVCVGSREELKSLTGVMLDDLHPEFVNELTFEKDGEAGTYRRITEVLDCWFESGSMPYAQLHYPFENEEMFEKGFPAEFIAEGLDQTRGWFYTLIVLGTALYGKSPFKNVIVNGIVMAEDGKKMSKRLRNYTPPDELMETYGADALRLALINSGLVKAEDQRFTDASVKDMVRRALLPWLNAFRFFNTYAGIDNWHPGDHAATSDNIMDQWILSRLETLKDQIAREMDAYQLYNVVPALFDFIEELTNWYIRLNRSRFWSDGMSEDKSQAFATLYTAIYELTVSMAPFTPFLAETLYKALPQPADAPDSVHLCAYPEADQSRRQPLLEQAVERMQHVILMGRQKRNQEKVKTKYPLGGLTVIHKDEALLAEIGRLEDYIKTELNVKQVHYDQDESHYISLYAKPNAPVLGKRLGKGFKQFKQAIESLSSEDIERYQEEGSLTLDGESFGDGDILVFREALPGTNAISDRFVSIDLDCAVTEALKQEGLAREVVNRIQKTRKDLGLNVADRIRIAYAASDELDTAIAEHMDYIRGETLAVDMSPSEGGEIAFEIDEHTLALTIERQSA